MRKIFCFLICILGTTSIYSQNIKVDRISDKIIILNEDYFRSVAILTEKGIVLVDTRQPLSKMDEIKQLVKQEFMTDKLCYIINTHGCPEHILGNSAFPDTPVIMNENFFNRKKTYAKQKHYVDSVEFICTHSTDSTLENEICSKLEEGRNWRKYCLMAMDIKPDISYSEKMTLHFKDLTIHLILTGLGHGYSTFIHIPEQRFLHVSTLSNRWAITKFTLPGFVDPENFISYQINTIKALINITDSLTHIVPCHGEYYSPDTLQQMLFYYTEIFDFAMDSYNSKIDFETYKSDCSIEKRFSEIKLFQNLNPEELQRHQENIEWLWEYFDRLAKN